MYLKPKIFVHLTICTTSIFLLVLILGCEKNRNIDDRYSVGQLRKDFNQLTELILNNQSMTFTDTESLRQTIDSQYKLLEDSMSVLEFRHILYPILAAVKCGHIDLTLPENINSYVIKNDNFLPLDINAVNDSLFVKSTFICDSTLKRGYRILTIDNANSKDIIQQLKYNMSADGDNETYKYFKLNNAFSKYYYRHIGSPEEFEVGYFNPQNNSFDTITIKARSRTEIDECGYVAIEGDSQQGLISARFVPDSNYAFLTVRFFPYEDYFDSFTEKLDDFFGQLSKTDINNLILDLRGNDGGNPYGTAHLLRYFIDKPTQYFSYRSAPIYDDLKRELQPFDNRFSGYIYALIDGGCFSTTGHFCSLLKYHNLATFIGGETGGSYICNGAYKEYSLQ